MKKQVLWLLVTTDKYELPLAVADTAVELARITGVKPNTVVSMASQFKKGKLKNCRYRKVEI